VSELGKESLNSVRVGKRKFKQCQS